MIVPDQRVGDMFIFKPKRSSIVYPNSALKNINVLTFELLDEIGNPINIVDQDGNKIIGNKIRNDISYDYNKYVENFKENNKAVKHTDNMTQVIYDISFNVVQNSLATLTSYNK